MNLKSTREIWEGLRAEFVFSKFEEHIFATRGRQWLGLLSNGFITHPLPPLRSLHRDSHCGKYSWRWLGANAVVCTFTTLWILSAEGTQLASASSASARESHPSWHLMHLMQNQGSTFRLPPITSACRKHHDKLCRGTDRQTETTARFLNVSVGTKTRPHAVASLIRLRGIIYSKLKRHMAQCNGRRFPLSQRWWKTKWVACQRKATDLPEMKYYK